MLLLSQRARRGGWLAPTANIARLSCLAHHLASGVIGRLCLGDPVLELDPRFVRRDPARLHRPAHLLLLGLDRRPRVVDLFLDAPARIVEGLRHRFTDAGGHPPRGVARDPGPPLDSGARFGARLRREQQRDAGADRGAQQKCSDTAAALAALDNDVPAVFVVEVVVLMTHARSVQRFFVGVFFAADSGALGTETGTPFELADSRTGESSINAMSSFRTSSCPTPSNLAVRDRSPPVEASVCRNSRRRPSENDAPTGIVTDR